VCKLGQKYKCEKRASNIALSYDGEGLRILGSGKRVVDFLISVN